MISLNELLQGEFHTNNELTKKYYRILQENLNDFLDNVVIDVTGGNTPLIRRDSEGIPGVKLRWIVMKDEYDDFNSVISNIVSKILHNTEDASKMN